MKILFSLIICTFCIGDGFAQKLPMPQIEARIVFSQISYTHPLLTHRWTEDDIKIDGYIYNIQISIKFDSNFSFDPSLYGIIYIAPNYSVNKLIFDTSKLIRMDSIHYFYSNDIKMKIYHKGWLRIFIASAKDIASDDYPELYEYTSNRQSIYLH